MIKINKVKINESFIQLCILLFTLFLIIIIFSGCSSKGLKFNTYNDVTSYCYSQNMTSTCGIEKCIMLNVAEFNDNIKFSAEKNYYQCELIQCSNKY